MTLAHLFTVFPELAKSRRVWKEQAGAGEKKQNGKLIYVILGILEMCIRDRSPGSN